MIKELLQESSGASTIASGRPTLVGFTRKVTDLLYLDLVGVQPTKQPVATVYAMRYDEVSDDGSEWTDSQGTHVSGTGKFMFGDTSVGVPADGMAAGDFFRLDGYYFQVIKPGNYASLDTLKKVFSKVLIGDLRCVADSIDAGSYQDGNEHIQNSRFVLNAWRSRVGSRKIKCPITMEALWDMEGSGLDSQGLLEDMLATTIADDVNSDIILKIITVATKHEPLDVSGVIPYYKGRTLIEKACSIGGVMKNVTTFDPTYLLTSANVGYIIKSSGQVDNDDMIVGTGMKLVIDNDADMEYMVVGTRHTLQDDTVEDEPRLACAAPVFFSPFEQEDEAGTYLVTRDPGSLQPVVGLMTRYALSAPPVWADMSEGAVADFGDDWMRVANKSDFAHALEVIL